MATRVITSLVDDLDGSEADSTVQLALDGTQYEIDLSTTNRDLLVKALEPYLAKARPVGRRATRRRGARNQDYDPAAVRAWATDQGIDLPKRGRISANVIAAYRAGHAS